MATRSSAARRAPVAMKPTPAFRAGIATRTRVLGREYVERSIAAADALTAPFQQIATEFAWGTVWQRPGLSLRERCMATVSMCIALNRPEELRIHVRGALNVGVTEEEIGELILHGFLYCGGPASLDAYRIAREVFAEQRPPKAGKAGKPRKARSPRKG
ncbi:MAG: carboxymuconolactone decarboxylase family protein [Burkholderiales bacterium]|jgi:4-carboxymuconolactone decarboxylase|nr:carboxymuconolactone decarboxylase family protein [Burkholderiales bacterium]